MRVLILTAAVLLMVSTLKAQQTESDRATPQPVQQEATENPQVQISLPDSIKPGHPLDPADVDILTGKRDREFEASRRAITQVVTDGYGGYGGAYEVNGWRFGTFNQPVLPLWRISNPFFLSRMPPRSFGSRGFGRR